MLHALPAAIRTPLSFAIVLGILVSVHEYGHYLVARLLGFRVEAFSIGFGKAIASWRDKHGTVWQLGWLPLGGYVKIYGFEGAAMMDPQARAAMLPGQGFHDHSVGARAAVAAAGPAANLLLTLVLYTALFAAIGQPVPSSVLGEVVAGSPAASAGLHAGDRVIAIDGTPISGFAALQTMVRTHPAQPIQLRIMRGGVTQTISVTPARRLSPGGRPIGQLGVASGPTAYQPVGLIGAAAAAARQSWFVIAQTAHGMGQVLTGQANMAQLGGTLRIAQMSGQVAKLGLSPFVEFIALLSVNLALLNLLPIPVLDGGHLMFYAIEAIRGRPLPPGAAQQVTRLGMGVVGTLLVFTLFNDLTHFGLFRWVATLIG